MSYSVRCLAAGLVSVTPFKCPTSSDETDVFGAICTSLRLRTLKNIQIDT